MSIKDQYEVRPIEKQETYPWLLKKHYAKRKPSISYAFGLYLKRILVGVCTFGMPPSPELRKICPGYNVLELNRLCSNDDLHKNALSFFVGNSLKKLPQPLVIVSFADMGQNHHGYIYQATNWFYTGKTKKQFDLKLKGTNKHSRHVYDNHGLETERVERTQKHRYVFFNGSKNEKNNMLEVFKFDFEKYPKGDNKRYNASFQPEVQGLLF